MSLQKKLTIAAIAASTMLNLLPNIVFAQSMNFFHSNQTNPANQKNNVYQWFQKYDQIRRDSQMTPSERAQADQLLSQGLSILGGGQDKDAAKAILSKLVAKYRRARAQMQALPVIPETQRLHRGYYQYFSTAGDLFSDYLTVQDNLFARDPVTGRPIMGQLLERKQHLEDLNNVIQDLDARLRAQWGIPAYQYNSSR